MLKPRLPHKVTNSARGPRARASFYLARVILTVGLAISATVLAFSSYTWFSQDDELRIVRRHANSGKFIVLIHGWLGASSSWEEFQRRLLSDKRIESYSVAVANYRTPILSSGSTTDYIAKAIEARLMAMGDAREVHLVVHSMGGIIARRLVISATARAPRIVSLVSLDTPYLGSSKAVIARILQLSPSYIPELSANSAALLELHSRWVVARQSGVSGLKELCFAAGTQDIVTMQSAIAGCSKHEIITGAGHSNILSSKYLTSNHLDALIDTLLNKS